ncbi:flagellar basal-body MS-ring/collar protein FliF [Acidaminobacterium chupaoyuni]
MNKPAVKELPKQIKEHWSKLKKKQKIGIGIIGGSIVLIAIFFTVFLNSRTSDYTVLYPKLSAAEAGSVYQALIEMGAKPKFNDNGEITVPSNEYDAWILQLASRGYPQTALTYDVFSSHSGLTATETDKQQWLLYQLQDRIQATLSRIDGVDNASVTITMPEKTSYAWQQAENTEKPRASVLLSLKPNMKLSGDQVDAIRNLIASSVPKMEADSVTVVNAKTGLELRAGGEKNGITNTLNLEYEQLVQQQLEENVTRLLAPRYGSDGIVAAAKVTLDYDKMITEKMELIEKPGEGEYLSKDEGRYTLNGEEAAGGIVGEENNTDIPEYAYTKPTDNAGMTYYWWNRNYDYGYIKTKVEHGDAILKQATISVMVSEENLTDARREELTSIISAGTNILPASIFVSSFAPPTEEEPSTQTDEKPAEAINWIEIAVIAGAGLLLLLVVAVVVTMALKKRKRKTPEDAAENIDPEELEKMRQAEIEKHKKYLEDMAKNGLDVKDEAITRDVQKFAKENPEITANLIRSWLKEGE